MYLLVADDLTGGNDAGVQFAEHGLTTRITLSPDCGALAVNGTEAEGGANPLPDMLVVNTNTRNMPGRAAAGCVAGMVDSLKTSIPFPPPVVFKKIDSTLRGNLGVEIDALMEGFGLTTAFFAPSYPDQGRTVENGLLLVGGVPVHETGFARDPLTPIRESSVARLMERQTGRRIGSVPLAVLESGTLARTLAAMAGEGVSLFLFDAETPEHLARIASAGMSLEPRPLFIGSAGLAAALARVLAVSPPAGGKRLAGTEKAVPVEHVFFLCGSAHQATHIQIDNLREAGVPLFRMPVSAGPFLSGDPAIRKRLADAIVPALRRGSAILATPTDRLGEPGDMAEGMALSAALAEIAIDVLRSLDADPRSVTLVMTGGETACGVLQRLGALLTLHGELFPGIALCSMAGGEWDGLNVVTKAGGFGTPLTMVDLLSVLRPSDAR